MDLTGSQPWDTRTCPECGSDLLEGDVCDLCLADLGEYPGRAAADLPPAAAGVGPRAQGRGEHAVSPVDLEPCAHCGGRLVDGSSFWLDPTGEGIHTGCEEQRRYEERREHEGAVAAALGSLRSRHTGHEHGRPLHSV